MPDSPAFQDFGVIAFCVTDISYLATGPTLARKRFIRVNRSGVATVPAPGVRGEFMSFSSRPTRSVKLR